MAGTASEIKDRLEGMVDRAKEAAGATPSADRAEGRIATVRGALQAFGDGDFDGFFAPFKEQAEWVAPKGKKFPGAGTQQGKEQIKEQFVEVVKRTYATFGFEPEHFLEGDQEPWVIALGTFVGQPAGGGKVEVAAAQLWTFEKDEVARVVIYTDSDPFPEPVSEEEAKEQAEKAEAQEREGDESGEDSEKKGSEESDEEEDEDSADGDGSDSGGSSQS